LLLSTLSPWIRSLGEGDRPLSALPGRSRIRQCTRLCLEPVEDRMVPRASMRVAGVQAIFLLFPTWPVPFSAKSRLRGQGGRQSPRNDAPWRESDSARTRDGASCRWWGRADYWVIDADDLSHSGADGG